MYYSVSTDAYYFTLLLTRWLCNVAVRQDCRSRGGGDEGEHNPPQILTAGNCSILKVLEVYLRVGQKSFKFLVGISGEMMTS